MKRSEMEITSTALLDVAVKWHRLKAQQARAEADITPTRFFRDERLCDVNMHNLFADLIEKLNTSNANLPRRDRKGNHG